MCVRRCVVVLLLVIFIFPLVPSWSGMAAALRECEVHHVPLQKDHVRISHGLVLMSRAHYEALKVQFPNANTSARGSCVSSPITRFFHRKRTVYFCPLCRDAETHWREEHADERY